MRFEEKQVIISVDTKKAAKAFSRLEEVMRIAGMAECERYGNFIRQTFDCQVCWNENKELATNCIRETKK